MSPTVADIMAVMESLAPRGLAEPWDNVGLQVGKVDWPVRTIWVALDPAPDVVAAACSNHVDMLITHHPLIFHALKTLDLGTPVGNAVQLAIRNQMAIFAAHTNFDAAADGLNDILAEKIGLVGSKILIAAEGSPVHGLGRIGTLEKAIPLAAYAERLCATLGVNAVRYVGRAALPVKRVAVCTGSGGSLMDAFLSCDADVYVTGDLRYHDARTAEWADVGLVDIGHFASEHLMVKALGDRLNKIFKERKNQIEVGVCDLETDPFHFVTTPPIERPGQIGR